MSKYVVAGEAQGVGVGSRCGQRRACEVLEMLQQILEGLSTATGDRFFRSLVQHLAVAFDVRYAMVCEVIDPGLTIARSLAFWDGGHRRETTYLLKGTPFEEILGGRSAGFPSRLRSLFPADRELAKLGAESCFGTPLRDETGQVLGYLAILHDQPLEPVPEWQTLLEIFASRATAELQRKKSGEALEESRSRLKVLHGISSCIIAGMGLPRVIRRTLEELRRSFPGLSALYGVLDRQDLLTITDSLGLVGPADRPLELVDSGLLVRQLRTLDILPIEDVTRDPWLRQTSHLFVEQGLGALLMAPFRLPDQELGLLIFGSPVRHGWSEHQLATLRQAAEYLAVAVEREYGEGLRLRAEKALRASEARLAQVYGAANDGIFILDSTGVIFEVNPAVSRMLGFAVEELAGKTFQSFHSGDSEAFSSFLHKVLESGSGFSGDLTCISRTNASIPVEISASTLELEGETRILAMVREISERKQAEAEHRRLEEQVRQAQKQESLGVLAGGIAHDFNNLLVGILGNADLIREMLPADTPAIDCIEDLVGSAKRAADLCSQMLAYSGKGQFVIEILDLRKVIEDMAQLLEISVSKKASFRYDFAEDTPSIEGDVMQIRQVIMNLVINASEALSSQSGHICIKTRVYNCDRSTSDSYGFNGQMEEGPYASLEVEDSGCGMAPDVLDKIFDPFFTTKFPGRGLGMAAVLGIVRGHRGALKVDSRPGEGSRVQAFFPGRAHEEVHCPESKGVKQMDSHDWQGTGTILVVDDEQVVRNLTKTMLERSGFKVLLAEDGRRGVAAFRENSREIVAVLLDMTMPEMDGFETLREIRKIQGNVRVILSSGYNEAEVLSQFSGKGLAGFIQKPFRLATLRDKIREVVEVA